MAARAEAVAAGRKSARSAGTKTKPKAAPNPKAKADDKGKARSGSEPPRRRAEDRESEALRSEVFGIGVLAAALCLMLALASFNPADVSTTGNAALTGRAHNLIGPVGAALADLLLYVFGLAAFLLPVTLAIPGLCFLTGKRIKIRAADAVGYPLLVLCCAVAGHLWMDGALVLGHDAGGVVGSHGGQILRALFGLTGAYILVYSALALTFVVTTRISLVSLAGRAARPVASSARTAGTGARSGASSAWRRGLERFAEWRVESAGQRADRKIERAEQRALAREEKATSKAERKAERAARKAGDTGGFQLGDLPGDGSGSYRIAGTGAQPAVESRPTKKRRRKAEAEPDIPRTTNDTLIAPAIEVEAEPEPVVEPPPRPVVKQRRPDDDNEQLEIPLPETERYGQYIKPPLHFLDYTDQDRSVDTVFLETQAQRLVEALSTFRIDGHVTEIHPGPVVTMYEFEPAPGVRISRIANLSDDLAMALKAVKVRIVAPIPGKGVVGFEVPNHKRETVFLKEIIASPTFRDKKHELPLSLGKDIHGAAMVTDLAKMPHLLVAGTTGSGKSVGVNAMITSLLYRLSPEEVRFIMVDPKMLELSIYEGIPHLLLPVVTDPKKAAMALKWAVDEMERRYEVMKDEGVRGIRGYNKKLEKLRLEHEANRAHAAVRAFADGEADTAHVPAVTTEPPPNNLPYIVVVIDEFADLMMVAGKEVEYCVARIAQKARAAGIHLILATQRPSTDVITGVIKANFPTRIAFQVSSGIDSRTILSTNGAENLLGKGDMLFLPPGTSRLTRVHGAFLDEKEIHQIVEFIAGQGEPEYLDESILQLPDDTDDCDDGDTGDMDPMYEEAVRTVFRDGRASTSHLQRRLSLGYNRAARVVDQMERDGLVGPSMGARPRTVNKALMSELIERWDSV